MLSRGRRKWRARHAGFTVAELMIAVGVAGILASLSIPTFNRYKDKARAAEAYTHLGAMYKGVKAYYDSEHWTEGTVGSGQASAASQCTVKRGLTTNSPTYNKTTLDWDVESPSFRAIHFTPTEPLLYHYSVGIATVPQKSTYGTGSTTVMRNGWFYGGACGQAASNNSGAYQIEARGRRVDGVVMSMYWNMCTTAEGNLFICGRATKPTSTVCSMSPGLASRSNLSECVVFVLMTWLVVHRRRRA